MRFSLHLPTTDPFFDEAFPAIAQLLETLTELNVKLLEDLPPLDDAGWKKIVLNDDDQENLLTAPAIYQVGAANILSLAALRAAQLRREGRPACMAFARVTRQPLTRGTIFVSCEVVVDGKPDESFEALRRSRTRD